MKMSSLGTLEASKASAISLSFCNVMQKGSSER